MSKDSAATIPLAHPSGCDIKTMINCCCQDVVYFEIGAQAV